ncbi:MAG: GNAT family N-acetyltransferase [Clostridia bacterium]|nr:GNAT family N-acetyltransferase [Clostridia bacterium]
MDILIKTERLTLRLLKPDDLLSVHEYAGNPENTRYMMFLPNQTVEETKEFIERALAEAAKDNPSFYEFAVELEGRVIGGAGLYLEGDCAELGWIINNRYQRKGYATEAAFALCDFAFKRLGLSRIIAHCDTRNRPSARVMEKLGMTLVSEGERIYERTGETAKEYMYEIKRGI